MRSRLCGVGRMHRFVAGSRRASGVSPLSTPAPPGERKETGNESVDGRTQRTFNRETTSPRWGGRHLLTLLRCPSQVTQRHAVSRKARCPDTREGETSTRGPRWWSTLRHVATPLALRSNATDYPRGSQAQLRSLSERALRAKALALRDSLGSVVHTAIPSQRSSLNCVCFALRSPISHMRAHPDAPTRRPSSRP